MSANLQGAMEDLIKVFYCYSGKEGDKYKLNKKELKNMLQEELSDFLTVSKGLDFFLALRIEVPRVAQYLCSTMQQRKATAASVWPQVVMTGFWCIKFLALTRSFCTLFI